MTRPGSENHHIIQAGSGDIGQVAQVIADAFQDLSVSRWLIPDPDQRRAIYPTYFAAEVRHALTWGAVHMTADRAAAAVWLPASGLTFPDPGYSGWLADLTGPHLDRFLAFDQERDRHHPSGNRHYHLAILAVSPSRQGHGAGTALLGVQHAWLDWRAIPAYLEASDTGTRDLYLRHGYQLLPGNPIQLPAGPQMWAMWRHPHPPAETPPWTPE